MEPITYVWNRFGQKLRPLLGPTIHMRADCTYHTDTPNNNRPVEMNSVRPVETRTVVRPLLGPTIHMRADCIYHTDTPNNDHAAGMNLETGTVDLKLQEHVAPEDSRANKSVWLELMAHKARTEQKAKEAQSARAVSAASKVSKQGNM